MRCAIYARRSTEEHQVASLDVQIAEAARYITAKGWQVAEAHVYRDDAVSRAEFKKRPGLIALLNAVGGREFDAVILRDDTRLGGDMHRTGLVVQDIIESGVRIFCYFEDDEITLDGATDKIMMALRGYAAELEREKIAGRTREHLMTKARRGLNTGGACYGYNNIPILDGSRRVGVDYEINAEEAAIVREVFERRAAGDGYRAIAKALNRRGVAAPKAGRRGSGSWAPTMVREMLLRERYAGVLVWGKAAKAYRGGTKVRLARAAADCIRVERPELRIIPSELWDATRATVRTRKEPWRAGAAGPTPRYLLSGLARCGECGGPIQVANGKAGREVIRVYACAHHRNRGTCANSLRRPVESVDAAVTNWIQANVLSEELIVDVIRELRDRLADLKAQRAGGDRAAAADQLNAQARDLSAEIDRLVTALADGSASPAITKAIADRESRLAAVRAELHAARRAPTVIDLESRRLENDARARLADLQALFARNVTGARTALESLLGGPLTLVPVEVEGGRRYRVDGSAALGALFTTGASPTGFEPVLQP
jgi:site-specific DNA recombinase